MALGLGTRHSTAMDWSLRVPLDAPALWTAASQRELRDGAFFAGTLRVLTAFLYRRLPRLLPQITPTQRRPATPPKPHSGSRRAGVSAMQEGRLRTPCERSADTD